MQIQPYSYTHYSLESTYDYYQNSVIFTGASASGTSVILTFKNVLSNGKKDPLTIYSLDSGKAIHQFTSTENVTQVLVDAQCPTRVYGMTGEESLGIKASTKVSYDFGQTWKTTLANWGERGFGSFSLGDSDKSNLYVAISGDGIWKRPINDLKCLPATEVFKEKDCFNGIDDDGNGKTDCADEACNEHELPSAGSKLCVNGKTLECGSYNKDLPVIKNVNNDFDVLCESGSWNECNADNSKREMIFDAKYPDDFITKEGPISYSSGYSSYLCVKNSQKNGKQQNGYNGYESWYVCNYPTKGDGVQSQTGDLVAGYKCTEKGWTKAK